jgi:hypothetical protein
MRALVVLTVALFAAGPAVAQGWPAMGDPVPLVSSKDPTYGYTERNPIRVGQMGRAWAEHAFLNALRGPRGEEIEYQRLGSCCLFATPNGPILGQALLDRYDIKYRGNEKRVILYLDMYDYQRPLVPVGFSRALLATAEGRSGVEEFAAFLARFQNDPAFRVSRIRFPLRAILGNPAEPRRKEKWPEPEFANKFTAPIPGDRLEDGGLAQAVTFPADSEARVQQSQPTSDSYMMIYRFKLKKGLWHLVEFEDSSH